jgi:cytochrome c oxidase accessory protein FixG
MSTIRTHAKKAALTGRPRVQTQWVWGVNEKRRWILFAIKFAIFLGLPWIPVDGQPALFFDLANRQFHVFGAVFWPQDFYMLGLVFAVAAVLLFFTTSLVGRVFCGHACPHTLLTSLFMQVDHWIEGDRPKRLAMDGGKWTPGSVARRALKHAVWLAIAGWMGFTFVSYFVGAHALAHSFATFSLSGPALGVWLFISALTLAFAGHLRDWVCVTVCPYGRFQSAMQDDDSLLVTFDAVRGDPRGKTKEVRERGGCVECGMCVTACPMGIDIREGYQYECITCGRCVDACDKTMDMIGAPGGLIRYVSLQEWSHHQAHPEEPLPPLKEHKWIRPRLMWYAGVLASLLGLLTYLVATRPLFGLEAVRDRGRIITLADGRVSNLYALKLLNKDKHPHRFRVVLQGLDGELMLGTNPIELAPGAIQALNASVVVKPGALDRPLPFTFKLLDATTGKVHDSANATFVGPTAASANTSSR